MNRYATFLAVVMLATGFAALRTIDEQPSTPEPLGLLDTLSDEQKIKGVLGQYRAFKGTLETTIDSLRRGQIRLQEANAIVREASNRYHPKYLAMLALSDAGATLDERVARNLIGHVHMIEAYRRTPHSPLPGLDRQLREFLAEVGE